MSPLQIVCRSLTKALLLLIISGVVVVSGLVGYARKSSGQGVNKSLDIERYPNEPLELVELKVGDQSVKNTISVKRRKDGEGLDNAKFLETSGWFTRVQVRLRNVSSKDIIGLRAYLYLEPPASKTLFRVPLTTPNQLQSQPLSPGAEIDLIVSDQSWRQTESILTQPGADANLAAVTLSLDIVVFTDGLQWNRGHLVRRDPSNPNRWIPISKALGSIGRRDDVNSTPLLTKLLSPPQSKEH